MGVDFNTIPPEDRNCIYLFLTHPAWRARLGRRDDVLPVFVSYFRAAMAEHRGDPLWEAKLARFFAVSEEFKICGISAMTCAVWKTSSSCLPILSLGNLPCSRCTGTLLHETVPGCWCICQWMKPGREQWNG